MGTGCPVVAGCWAVQTGSWTVKDWRSGWETARDCSIEKGWAPASAPQTSARAERAGGADAGERPLRE
jgi:hypothetical protein